MKDIFWFCLFNWVLGSFLLLSSICDWRASHIRYLSDTKVGKVVSRTLTGAFGCVVIGIGLLLWMAPA